MANLDAALHTDHAALPRINVIGNEDLFDALRRGWGDFLARPSHYAFAALIYPIAGILLAQLTVSYDILPMLFPLVAGFALIGPFAALGLYEISRRRERGMDASWSHALRAFRSRSIGDILLVAAMLGGLFVGWLLAAWLLYRWLYGAMPITSLWSFASQVLTTPTGWALIVIGHAVGFAFAALAFAIGVVSFPLMLDRHVDAATAVRTSIAAVKANPVPMAVWAGIVAGLLILGSATALVGLVVVMPLLGHASWHLYRKVIAD